MKLLALPLFAQEGLRHTFEWGAIQSNVDWILPVGACVALMVFVLYMYQRDTRDMNRLWGVFLAVLRSAVFFGLLIFYLQPQWRTEKDVDHNSRALLLVDTSLSMGLTDSDDPTAETTLTRIKQVATALANGPLLDDLRNVHDVGVFQFNDGLDRDRMVALDKHVPVAEGESGESTSPGKTNPPTDGGDSAESEDAPAKDDAPVDWPQVLAPAGTSTQLGQALQQLIYDEQDSPVSAILLFSDGGKNKGVGVERSIEAARKANIPVYVFGIGSDRRPTNVRVSDLVAPARAYPGDAYKVTGYLQAQQMAGQVVDVQLLAREATNGSSEPGSGQVVETQQVTLGGDGEVVPVKFELTPDATGRQTLSLQIKAPADDRDPADNLREVDVEIVDRKNRVLLLAGGPTREYRFVRTMLYRDRSTTVDVLLQTAQPGVSQEANELLDDFPATREEMFQYDCVLGFDPDWQALSVSQVDLLETWVAEQGGGLIVVAGPVYAGRAIGGWIEDANMAKIRALYPVEFKRRFSVLAAGAMDVRKEPWPLEFTREGLEAEYLWLDDTATLGRQAWAGFPGVFSYCPVRGAKPGATVLARFSDPRTGPAGDLPVYFASQFYGSGRVFYIGSGEMWRLRAVEDRYFEQLYTKLIRHASQGRLLRGSSRGVLLVGQDRYLLGDTVQVRTQLTNSRLEPLDMPSVDMQVILPDATLQTVTLKADPVRPGTYAGQFATLEEGSYRLELLVPESDDERLVRRIQVNVPNLEREQPQRNDALLSRIAERTGGEYYVGLNRIISQQEGPSLASLLKDRTKTTVEPVTPDREWEQTWRRWLMISLCCLLFLEWLIRRLIKLA